MSFLRKLNRWGIYSGAPPAAAAPDAFSVGQWTATDRGTVDGIRLAISALPAANGSAITDLEFHNGTTWASLGGTSTGDYDLDSTDGLTYNTSVNLMVRAVNAVGNGANSDVKAATPTGSADTDALNARFTTPMVTARAKLYQALYASLRTGATSASDILAKLDILWVLAANDLQAAQRNLVADARNLPAASGTVTFTQDRGTAGNGTDGFFETNIAMNSLTQFTQNSGSIGMWCRTDTTNATMFDLSTSDGAHTALNARSTTGTSFRGAVNANSFNSANVTADSIGFFAMNRSAVSSMQLYENGVAAGTNSTASTTVGTNTIRVHRHTTTFCTRQLAAVFYGGSLTANEHADLYNAINTYLVAVGAA